MDEIGSLAKTNRELVARLKHFPYPYPDGNKKGNTFYSHLKKLGLLALLLSPPLLWDIRMVWFFRRHARLEKSLKAKKLSEFGFPLDFHRKMAIELFDHLERITQLAEQHEVPDMEWFAEYYAAIQAQFLREGAAYYPELRRSLKPFHRLRTYEFSADNQVMMYDALHRAFSGRNLTKTKLAQQLTALICSRPDCIETGKLDPSPDSVRKNVKRKQKEERTKQRGRKKRQTNTLKNS